MTDVVRNTAADLLHLASAELKLVKLEVVSGLRARSARIAFLAVGLVPLLVGYLFALAALAAWLTPRWGLAGALGATALSQGLIGGIVLAVASRSAPSKAREGAHA